MKDEWMNEDIISYIDNVVQELAKEFQLGYDLPPIKWICRPIMNSVSFEKPEPEEEEEEVAADDEVETEQPTVNDRAPSNEQASFPPFTEQTNLPNKT